MRRLLVIVASLGIVMLASGCSQSDSDRAKASVIRHVRSACVDVVDAANAQRDKGDPTPFLTRARDDIEMAKDAGQGDDALTASIRPFDDHIEFFSRAPDLLSGGKPIMSFLDDCLAIDT